MTFNEATQVREQIEAECEKHTKALRRFPRGPMGLPSEKDRLSPEYQAASRAFALVFMKLQDFNKVYVKRFAKEIKAERDKKRASCKKD